MVKRTSLLNKVFPRACRVRFLVPVLLLADVAWAAASDSGYDSLEFTSNVMSRSALRQAVDDHSKVPYTSKTEVSTLGGGSDPTTDPTLEPDVDSDGDGVYDSQDNCPFDFNPDQANSDGDTLGDVCDEEIDRDGDGVPDNVDNCPTVSNVSQTDTDQDGQGNACDSDDDGDGVPDTNDACPLQAGTDNGCPVTSDADGDGVPDNVDNCPNVANANQADTDQDGEGNACDSDDDGDGVPDTNDACPLQAGTDNGCPVTNDADGDGVDDSIDNCPFFFNPDQANLDADSLGDACDEDMDGDGVDNTEDAFPDDPDEAFDTDSDGIGNNADTDDDNDGLLDLEESQLGTDPLSRDSDGDGWTDLEEVEEGSDPLSRESEPELGTGLSIWLLYVATQGGIDPDEGTPTDYLDDLIEGSLTYYSLANVGIADACSMDFNATPDYPYKAAVPSNLWLGSIACGDVYEVKCAEGADTEVATNGQGCQGMEVIQVAIVDLCLDCLENQLQLDTEAAQALQVSSTPSGLLNGTLQRVPRQYTGNVHVRTNDGSLSFWLSLTLTNSNRRIVALEVQSTGSNAWISATLSDTNRWVISPSEELRTPVSVRITSEDGSQLASIDTVTTFDAGEVYDFGSQFE